MTDTQKTQDEIIAQKEITKKNRELIHRFYDLSLCLSDDEKILLGEFVNKHGPHGVIETLFPETRIIPREKFAYTHRITKPYDHIERCNLLFEPKRYVIRIELDSQGAFPFSVNRRFEVPSNMWMEEFGPLVLEIMGWNNSHLHAFFMNDKQYVSQWQYDDQMEILGEEQLDLSYNTMTVMDFLKKSGDSVRLMYDYGDSWEHVITLEEVTDYEPDSLHPSLVLDGENACPPDDCGGVFGYADLLSIISDRKHPEYKDYKEWLPRGFKPNAFDVLKKNRNLKRLGF